MYDEQVDGHGGQSFTSHRFNTVNHTLFISDLHLQADRPDITGWFFSLLQKRAPQADALYILGDLFELWVGDDDHSPFHQSIIAALRQLADSGVPVYFLPGNRDFLVGQAFLTAAGAQLLPDPCKITLYDTPLLLTHGDLLCTLDKKHQVFRRYSQSPGWRRCFLALPLRFRVWLAALARRISRHNTSRTESYRMDVTPDALAILMQQEQVQLLIHGHTHRPDIHAFTLNGKPATRIVLGDWHHSGHALIYYADGHYEMIRFEN